MYDGPESRLNPSTGYRKKIFEEFYHIWAGQHGCSYSVANFNLTVFWIVLCMRMDSYTSGNTRQNNVLHK